MERQEEHTDSRRSALIERDGGPPAIAGVQIDRRSAQPSPGAPAPPWLTDFLFRAGLLLGAGLFLFEAMGSPWSFGLYGAAGVIVALLIVLTMAFNWRVLGDWRLRTQQLLYAGMTLIVAIPITAALSPGLGATALPDGLERFLVQFIELLKAIPGVGLYLQFMAALITFLVLGIILLILVLGSRGSQKGGILLISAITMLVCLFLYPQVETVAGFLFLILFVYNVWEVPLLIPGKLWRHMKPVQVDYLRELVRIGSLSTGETKLYLDNEPSHFGEMLELQLVEYDAMTRTIYPGERLLHDPSAEFVELVFTILRRVSWVLVAVIYVLLPDFLPGPIDDFIIVALCTASGFDLFRFGRARGRAPRQLR